MDSLHQQLVSLKGFLESEGYHNEARLVEKKLQQFTYRYVFIIEHNLAVWEQFEEENKDCYIIDSLKEALIDGIYNELSNEKALLFHEGGIPSKLAVKWHIKKSEYTAYFWFEDKEICKVFDRFYGAHPETKTEFMIRIDAEQNKYELALYRYGLKEPQVINESAYQLIVFKNKFEYFRSENYDQPRGAWIW